MARTKKCHDYSEAELQFMMEHTPKRCDYDAFCELFGNVISFSAYSHQQMRITQPDRKPNHRQHRYTVEQNEFIRSTSHMSIPDQVELFNKTYNAHVTVPAMEHRRARLKCTTPGAGYWQKGHVPHNTLPVGTFRVWDGRPFIKEEQGFVSMIHHVWKEYGREVPEGYVLINLDHDLMNCDINNIACVPRAVCTAVNARKEWTDDTEITKAYMLTEFINYETRKVK